MQYKEFIGNVESNLQPISTEEAERAAEATLSTLSELISPEAAKNLRSHLPTELADKLDHGKPENPRELAAGLSLEDFSEIVADKEGVGVAREEGRIHAIGVMKAVKEVYGVGADPGSSPYGIDGSELDEIRGQLPEDFAPLFT